MDRNISQCRCFAFLIEIDMKAASSVCIVAGHFLHMKFILNKFDLWVSDDSILSTIRHSHIDFMDCLMTSTILSIYNIVENN